MCDIIVCISMSWALNRQSIECIELNMTLAGIYLDLDFKDMVYIDLEVPKLD